MCNCNALRVAAVAVAAGRGTILSRPGPAVDAQCNEQCDRTHHSRRTAGPPVCNYTDRFRIAPDVWAGCIENAAAAAAERF